MTYIAKLLNGERVKASDANKSDSFFCELCNQPLFLRSGAVRDKYFAHTPIRQASSSAYVECASRVFAKAVSRSHAASKLMEFASTEQVEKIIEHNSKKHVADLLINNTAVEFINPSYKVDSFVETNNFYKEAGYKVIWVIDIKNDCINKKITRINLEYTLNKPIKLFSHLDLDEGNYDVFIHDEYEKICQIDSLSNDFKSFTVSVIKTFGNKEFIDFLNVKQEKIHYLNNKPESSADIDLLTLKELWQPNFKTIIVTDTSTGQDFLVKGMNGHPFTNNKKLNGAIVGKYSDKVGKNYKYSTNDYTIKNQYKPVWKLKVVLEYDK